MEIEKNMYYAEQIITSICNLFVDDDQKEYCHIDENELNENDNFTEFLIGYLKAGVLFFNQMTGKEKTYFEFTHILNQLCVQDMVKGTDLIKGERRI